MAKQLLVFTGPTCAWCKVVLRELDLIEIEKKVDLDYRVVDINEEPEVVEEMQVIALPTLIFPDGTRTVGAIDGFQLRKLVERSMFYLFPKKETN